MTEKEQREKRQKDTNTIGKVGAGATAGIALGALIGGPIGAAIGGGLGILGGFLKGNSEK